MPIGTAISGIATGVGMLGSAKMQSGAAGRGARLQTDAANEFNTRASELSRGRTEDRRYGENQKQFNTMRRLMGMPNKALSVYVEPEALRLTAPVVPDYVEDPTDFSDPNDPNKNRLV